MSSFVCTRCHEEKTGGHCFDFGSEEVFGQILGQTCAECCWALLCVWRDQAEDLQKLRREVVEDLTHAKT